MYDQRIKWQDMNTVGNQGANDHLPPVQLTGREIQVLRMLVQGLAYKQIASELSISIKTVEFYASKVFKKLRISNRFELADAINQNY